MLFGLIPGYGSTNAIFILKLLKKKYLAKKVKFFRCLCRFGEIRCRRVVR